jgi:hypothetical protein
MSHSTARLVRHGLPFAVLLPHSDPAPVLRRPVGTWDHI